MTRICSRPFAAGVALCAALAGCAGPDAGPRPPTREAATTTGTVLRNLPPPKRRIDVAVYAYEDRTGQQKPNDFVAEFSKAVTQGADAILIDVLKSTAGARWFTVVERVGLTNLLTERNLIEQSHKTYAAAEKPPLPALRFAGMLLEGGVINYDSNTETGGAGARLLGIGASAQYRRDSVTVFLRAVSVSSGEVLQSVTATKTIYSVMTQGSVFRYISSDEILEAEAGFARNEPTGLAVRQAIELAVYSLILEGAERGLWAFADRAAQKAQISLYRTRQGGPAEPADATVGPAVSAASGQSARAQPLRPAQVPAPMTGAQNRSVTSPPPLAARFAIKPPGQTARGVAQAESVGTTILPVATPTVPG